MAGVTRYKPVKMPPVVAWKRTAGGGIKCIPFCFKCGVVLGKEDYLDLFWPYLSDGNRRTRCHERRR